MLVKFSKGLPVDPGLMGEIAGLLGVKTPTWGAIVPSLLRKGVTLPWHLTKAVTGAMLPEASRHGLRHWGNAAALYGAGTALAYPMGRLAAPDDMSEAVQVQRGSDVGWLPWAVKSSLLGPGYWLYRQGKADLAKKWQQQHNLSMTNAPGDPGTWTERPSPEMLARRAEGGGL